MDIVADIEPPGDLVKEPVIFQSGVAEIKPQYVRKRSHDEATPTDDITATPPPKKKKHGQHKHRPPLKIPFSTQLCPSLHIHSGNQCSFGNKCRYIHDIAKYLNEKPVDIGEHCYIFETYGFCPSGLACRFGRSHISSEHVNIQRDESQPSSQLNSVYNVIPRYLQEQLRKRRLKFPRSNMYMKQLKNNQPSDNSEVKRGVDLVTPESRGEIVDKIEYPVLVPEISDSEKVSEPVVMEGSTTDALVTDLEGEHKKSSENIANETCPEYDNTSGNKKLFDEEIIVRGNESGRTSLSDSKSGEDVCAVKDLCVDVMNVSSCNEDRSEDTCSVNNKVVDADTKVTGNPHVHPSENPRTHTSGSLTDEDLVKLKPLEKKKVDFRDKLYLAPLTTVGNLPFRRICKRYGADITCGEMAMSTNLLQGQQSEWALLKRHESEDLFGVQVCGSFPDTMTRCAELISSHCTVDFVDINVGCPIDLVFKKGAGCALMQRKTRFQQIVTGMSQVLDCPLTVKMRTGIYDKNWNAHKLIPNLRDWGASLVTVHGRSREQRYTKFADWKYINQCAQIADPMPLFGNGDILSFEDYNQFREVSSVAGVMVARGALIKPWIFTEIKEQRHWDISSSERLDIIKEYTHYGLEHWGSDTQGVERTRRFLLEWLSFFHRYIPVGILERVPQRINERPPYYEGRDEMETLMSSRNCQDWIKISEMFLGPVPINFSFLPKHKANSYS